MAKYHIRKDGNPGKCSAKPGNCPYGFSEEEHFSSAGEARRGYEKTQEIFAEEPTVVNLKGIPSRDHAIPLDSDTEKLISELESRGLKGLIVGGTVRDSLVENLQPKDVDIEIYGAKNMDELSETMKSLGYKVDEVGKQFGVIKTVLNSGMDIDLSLPRKDNLVGKGHRGFEVEVNPDLSLREASERRDFTINSMYYDHTNGKILDPNNGLEDWESKTLRPIGEAFKEDPLRVLRGVQFASRFGLSPSQDYIDASTEIHDTFGELSSERVQEEFSKLFTKGKDIARGLDTLRQSSWGDHFGFDEKWYEENDLEKIRADFEEIKQHSEERELDRSVLSAAYLARTQPDSDRMVFLRQSLIGDKPQNRALRLSQEPSLPLSSNTTDVRRWAREMDREQHLSVAEWGALNRHFLDVGQVDEIEKSAINTDSFRGPNRDILTGKIILEESGESKGGKWIGEILKDASDAQDNEVFLSEENARKWLRNRLGKRDL